MKKKTYLFLTPRARRFLYNIPMTYCQLCPYLLYNLMREEKRMNYSNGILFLQNVF